jgi:SAM-dependent methyltransferase
VNNVDSDEVSRVYARRFGGAEDYRRAIWRVLVSRYFQRLVPPDGAVLDLGCGYGEFINTVRARRKLGMDLNPDSKAHLDPAIEFLHHDCSLPWPLQAAALDAIFTSNFFEHLPDKPALGRTLAEAFRCLKPGGRLIAMGPNIKFTKGAYWDFWDHHVALTEASLSEALETRGFEIVVCHARFLPYTMAKGPQYPPALLALYLRLPLLWRMFGQQFLIVARKPAPQEVSVNDNVIFGCD